jgi:hypothetical protein
MQIHVCVELCFLSLHTAALKVLDHTPAAGLQQMPYIHESNSSQPKHQHSAAGAAAMIAARCQAHTVSALESAAAAAVAMFAVAANAHTESA